MSDLPEPAATIYRLTIALRDDLAFAAPELWTLHMERRLAQAYEAGQRASGSEIGSETPDSPSPTHESHNTAGIGTGEPERA